MKCPKCGHPSKSHTTNEFGYNAICINDGKLCSCTMTPEIIEIVRWRAEAEAARALIEGISQRYPDMMQRIFPASLSTYLAARVEDTE